MGGFRGSLATTASNGRQRSVPRAGMRGTGPAAVGMTTVDRLARQLLASGEQDLGRFVHLLVGRFAAPGFGSTPVGGALRRVLEDVARGVHRRRQGLRPRGAGARRAPVQSEVPGELGELEVAKRFVRMAGAATRAAASARPGARPAVVARRAVLGASHGSPMFTSFGWATKEDNERAALHVERLDLLNQIGRLWGGLPQGADEATKIQLRTKLGPLIGRLNWINRKLGEPPWQPPAWWPRLGRS